MKKLVLIMALAGAFAAQNAQAWGNDGHRAVGAIADKLLKGSNAQKQLAAILFPGESLLKLGFDRLAFRASSGRKPEIDVVFTGMEWQRLLALTEPLKKTGGRNANGRITTRHQGGGHKRRYRTIDFKRVKDGVPAKVAGAACRPAAAR